MTLLMLLTFRAFLLTHVSYGKTLAFYNKLVLSDNHSTVTSLCYPQASDLTGGIYIKVPEPAGLVQFMLVCRGRHEGGTLARGGGVQGLWQRGGVQELWQGEGYRDFGEGYSNVLCSLLHSGLFYLMPAVVVSSWLSLQWSKWTTGRPACVIRGWLMLPTCVLSVSLVRPSLVLCSNLLLCVPCVAVFCQFNPICALCQ